MVILNCALVGARGVVSVQIEEWKTVGLLKGAIKPKIGYLGLAKDLRLFLAKKKADDGKEAWLEANSEDVKMLKKRKKTVAVEALTSKEKELQGKTILQDVLLDGMPTPSTDDIHVLVEVPEADSRAKDTRQAKLTPLAKLLKNCDVVGDLPKEGAFVNLLQWTDDDCGTVMDIKAIDDIVHFTGPKFYVRKEVLCVLENFKQIYQAEFDTGKLVYKQMILMGSPGTGKRCLLALLCFHLAVQYHRPVVWFHPVAGGIYPTATRLFYQGKYYEWEDQDGEICASLNDALHEETNRWVVLDGMTQAEIREKKWFNMYKMLATSGQFSPSSEAMQFTKKCLVPLWRLEDLDDFGRNHLHLDQNDVDARLFVSGGSVRAFLNPDSASNIAKVALDCIETADDAKRLLTMKGIGSNDYIDCIRMRGVQDRNNAKQYVDVWKWTCCVMSKLVLQHLVALVKPDFFKTLMGIAKGMNDDRLEDAAFEGYFHSLVRHQGSILVEYCEYDNKDWGAAQNGENVMDEVGSIEVKKPSLVQCRGLNRKECVAVMTSWAAKPSEMVYWVPATSLCETIDGVARWTFPDGVERFCFLQLTKAPPHRCDAAILWELAQPFVEKRLPVCYIALLPDDPGEDKRRQFRFHPAVITQPEVVGHIRLYVARFKVTPCHEDIKTTSS